MEDAQITKKFPAESFERARNWIYKNARPLELARWKFLFENGSSDRVRQALAAFQNANGGFHGLECDIRTSHSSPIATSIALHYLIELHTSVDHPLVKGAVSYLLETLNRDSLTWSCVTEEANASAHAPWWTFDSATGHSAPDSALNPTAEITGWFHFYQKLIRPELLAQLTAKVVQAIESAPEKMEMHDLIGSLSFWERVNPDCRSSIGEKLLAAAKTTVSRTAEEWESYSIKPLSLAPSPSSLVAIELESAISENLDWEMERQESDGSWPPSWTWYDGKYAEAWPVAEKEWRGVLTLKQVRSLRDYGRL